MKWYKLKGYEGEYEISKEGLIKSLKKGKEKVLACTTTKHGYKAIELRKDGIYKKKLVHRLVLSTFKPTENESLQCNHINSVRDDNRIENLEWVTRRENIAHATNRRDTYSKLTGVSYSNDSKRWHSSVTINSKVIRFGVFVTEHEAALAYKEGVTKLGIENKYAVMIGEN